MEQDPFPEFDWGKESRLRKAARAVLNFFRRENYPPDDPSQEPTPPIEEDKTYFMPSENGHRPKD